MSEPKEHLRGLLEEIAKACNWGLQKEGNLLVLSIITGEGRTQKVFVKTDLDIAQQPIARYWTVMGASDLVDPERCLQENAQMDYGHFAILDDSLVLMDTQLIEDADPQELGSALTYLGSYADRFEEALFGGDEH